MLAVVGPQVGRMQQTGSDPWGRFTWTELSGQRDEVILVISAYRVSQTKGSKSGPNTAYSQQIGKMIVDGDFTLDPRTRILHDLRDLITDKRAQGYRPILMMDANDTWLQTGSKAFTTFIADLNLIDPLYNKFKHDGITPSTYSRGSRRIDFIFVDPPIEPSIKRIGTLGLHEDHAASLFRGIINRPVLSPAREFVIEHADKAEKFLKRFKELASDKKFRTGVLSIAESFAAHGPTQKNINLYNTLDKEILECALSAAKSVAKKKFGYQRSPSLTAEGARLHFWQAVLTSNLTNRDLNTTNINKAAAYGHTIAELEQLKPKSICQHIRTTRRALWDVQKEATEKRI
ncbi:hypothetical protein ACHAXR_001597, partial [Thalassiosira sp. AJA248-18]